MLPFLAVVDGSGWVSIDPIRKYMPSIEDVESSSENMGDVVFCKDLGSEKISIKFPFDPKYQYLSATELEIEAQDQNQRYTLTVLDRRSDLDVERLVESYLSVTGHLLERLEKMQPNMWHLECKTSENWVFRSYIQTPFHVFILESVRSDFQRENHEKFVSSLEISLSKK